MHELHMTNQSIRHMLLKRFSKMMVVADGLLNTMIDNTEMLSCAVECDKNRVGIVTQYVY